MLADATLAIHIAAGGGALALGPVAMWAGKRRGIHTRTGEAYHWLVLATAASAVVLAALDPAIWWLGVIAVFSYGFALAGYAAAKRRRGNWLRVHVSGQGGSYIAVVTAFLVVNLGGSASAPWIAWAAPTVIGSVLLGWVNYQVAIGRRPRSWRERVGRAEAG